MQNPTALAHPERETGRDLLFLPSHDPITEVDPEGACFFRKTWNPTAFGGGDVLMALP